MPIRSLTGPSILVVAAILGPGTIFASAKVGAYFGYAAVWIFALSAILLSGMLSLAAHVGLVDEKTPFAEIAERIGKRSAAALGILVFLALTSLLAGNNLVIIVAIQPYLGHAPSISAVLTINLLGLAAIYLRPDCSRHLKTLVGALVLTIALAFLVVAFAVKPSPLAALAGLIPVLPKPGYEVHDPYLILQNLIAASFSVTAAFYFAYLVRQRGWSIDDTQRAQGAASFGIIVLAGISLVVMTSCAAVFYGKPAPPSLAFATDVGTQLGAVAGAWGGQIFNLAVLLAAMMSLVVNALIAGTLLSDSLGGGAEIGSRWPRHATALALVVGLMAGLARWDTIWPVKFAGAFAPPALACALIYLVKHAESAGKCKLPRNTLSLAYLGAAVALVLTFRTTTTLITELIFKP